jgi:cyclohexanone monooxygenase
MVGSIEFHVEWITECLRSMLVDGKTRIEATEAAQDRWVDHVNAIANMTLFPSCNSWYLGANVPGKPRVFMPLPGHPGYMKRADAIAAAGYEGFELQ